MPFNDLRTYVEALERQGELKRVAAEVDPVHEIGLICKRLAEQNGPAVLFEHVKGSEIPLVCNLLTSRRRLAMVFDTNEASLADEYARRSHPSQFRPAQAAESAPCKELIAIGNDADVTTLPSPVWNDGDAGPYITFGAVRIKDPSGRIGNVSITRLQVQGPRQLGIYTGPDRDCGRIAQLWWDQGKPAPVAVVIGAEPTYLLAAAQHLPFGIDEHMLASALLGSPLQTVKCESSDLDIPGSAEIVIEGEMPPGRTQIEGPFGEFLGYMGPSDPSPVIEINAITRRRDALYVGSYEGMPDVETHALYRLNLENNLRLVLGNLGPVITDVYVPNGSAGMAARIAIRKRLETDGLQVINGAFNVWTFKFVTVFDDDVDIRDEAKVQWATVSRVQPDRDLVFGRGQAYTLDPSAYRQPPARLTATTSRLGIDATRSLLSERPPVLRFSPDLERRVSARWSEFGL